MHPAVEAYNKRRSDRKAVAAYRARRQARMDSDEGHWATTEEGNKIHINENGVVDKGNPYVVAKANRQYLDAARKSENAIEFWMNLNEAQQEVVGKAYKDLYANLKPMAGQTGEWVEPKGAKTDMPTVLEKPNRPIEFQIKNYQGKSKSADADVDGVITLNAAESDTWSDDVFAHEMGHQISALGLLRNVAENPGGLFGQYNQKHNLIENSLGMVEKNPDESFAWMYAYYRNYPRKLREKDPDGYSYFKKLDRDNPWLKAWVDDSFDAYRKVVSDYENAQRKDSVAAYRARRQARLDGGPGSGNFGHAGRPGEIGGSSGSGGVSSFSTGAAGDEVYMRSEVKDGKRTAGYMDWSEWRGTPSIKYIQVEPGDRGKGLATKMLQDLQRKYPDTEIDFGMTTPDGTKLLDAITYEKIDPEVKQKTDRLARMNKDLDACQQKLDRLFEIEEPTEKQQAEINSLGDKWQDLYDGINDLKKEVDGQKPVKRLVKLDSVREDEEPAGWITVNGNHIPINEAGEPVGGQMKAIGGESNKSGGGSRKSKQFALIQKSNPMHDDIHTGIRKESDIHTLSETLEDEDEFGGAPDWTYEDAEEALKSGEVTLYSSYPIEDGIFVTPSKMIAKDYAGGGEVHSKTVPIEDVAWIAGDEGQYAPVVDDIRGVPSAKDISPAMKPKNTGYDFSLDYDEDDFLHKNAGNSRKPTPLYELYKETQKNGGDGGEAIRSEFYKTRLEACTTDLKEISRDEADEVLYDNLRQGTVDAWFREYNHEAKAGLVWQLTRNPETHNAALNVMYQNYKSVCDAQDKEPLSYDEFLVTPVKMYRGGSGEEYKKAGVFSSYTFDRDMAERFTHGPVGKPSGSGIAPGGVVYEAEIRPIDTYGSVFHTAELEILVPSYIAPNGNRDEADVRQLDADRAIHLYEEIKKRHEGRKAVKAYKERRKARMDEEEPKAWITADNGTHIPLDESGKAIGGPLKGENFSRAKTENNESKSGHAVKSSIKGVRGKDITSTYKHDPSKCQFAIEDVVKKQGFDALPKVVSPEEFDKACGESGIMLKRAYGAKDQEVLDAYRESLYSGEWFINCSRGGAKYGRGMYCAQCEQNEDMAELDAKIANFPKKRGDTYTTVETLTLSKDANVITYNALRREFEGVYDEKEFQRVRSEQGVEAAREKVVGPAFDLSKDLRERFQDVGAWAAALGYDAINVQFGGFGGRPYWIILNRGKCIIRKPGGHVNDRV